MDNIRDPESDLEERRSTVRRGIGNLNFAYHVQNYSEDFYSPSM